MTNIIKTRHDTGFNIWGVQLHKQTSTHKRSGATLSYIIKMSFQRCSISNISIQMVSNLGIKKKVCKRKYCPQFHCLFEQSESTHFFFETH